jgi:glycosyltransferase involved in cell wall biosynthesis
MRILQLSPQVPLPSDNGGKIGIYGITKYLSERGNEIHFVAFKKASDKEQSLSELKKICIPHLLNVSTKNSLFDIFINLFSPVPYNISKYYKEELKHFLADFFHRTEVDIIHIDHLHLGWCVDVIKGLTSAPVVLREHNLELKIMQRYSENQHNYFLKKYSEIQYRKFLKYEPVLAGKFDECIMVSGEDEKSLLEMNPKVKTTSIGVGVNSNSLNFIKKETIPYSIFHLGSLEWFPNHEGLKWYLEEIFPLILKEIPEVKLYLYGKGTEKVKISDNISSNIINVGYVQNVWAEIADKQLAIVPLRIGSGIRVKIIEMLGIGQNILSTSIGKEGIDVEDGKEIIIADSAQEFITKTISYFNHVYNSEQLSKNAKNKIREKYTWEKIAEQFENEYKKLILISKN